MKAEHHLVQRLRCVAVALRQDRPYAAQAALEAAELIEQLSDQIKLISGGEKTERHSRLPEEGQAQ